MKKICLLVFTLAGVLGFIPCVSLHAQGSGSYNEMIELELDGWVGDGGNYAVFIGLRPKYEQFGFDCGFTVSYSIGDAAYNMKLVGEAHYNSYSSCLESFNGTTPRYYFPKDDGYVFLRLDETYIGPWPTELCLMIVDFIPDDPTEIWDFRRIIIDAKPFIDHLSSVTADGGKPVGLPFSEWYVAKNPVF